MRGVPKTILKRMAGGIQGASKTTLIIPHHKFGKLQRRQKLGRGALVLKPDLETIDKHNEDFLIRNVLKDTLSMDDENSPLSSHHDSTTNDGNAAS